VFAKKREYTHPNYLTRPSGTLSYLIDVAGEG